ncbi:MAG: hypothetical protein IPF82_17045 [Blastocatellia bacterium]|nr:hypothetical protein [Blastocatellia bacterium]
MCVGRSTRRSENRLGKRTDELFKPTGVNPTINRLLADLQNVRRQLASAQGELTEYNTLLGRLSDLTREVDEAAQGRRDALGLLRRWETTSNSWEDWVTLAGVEEQLRLLDVSGFPKDGSERLDLLLASLDERKRAVEKAEAEQVAETSEFLAVAVNESALASAAVITDLAGRRAEFAAARQARDAAASRRDELESTIAVDLQRLGPEWSVVRACGIDRSLFTLEAVNRFDQDIEESRHALDRATAARDAAARGRTRRAGGVGCGQTAQGCFG